MLPHPGSFSPPWMHITFCITKMSESKPQWSWFSSYTTHFKTNTQHLLPSICSFSFLLCLSPFAVTHPSIDTYFHKSGWNSHFTHLHQSQLTAEVSDSVLFSSLKLHLFQVWELALVFPLLCKANIYFQDVTVGSKTPNLKHFFRSVNSLFSSASEQSLLWQSDSNAGSSFVPLVRENPTVLMTLYQ